MEERNPRPRPVHDQSPPFASSIAALALCVGATAQTTPPPPTAETLFAERPLKRHLPDWPEFQPAALADLDGDGRADLFDAEMGRVALAGPGGRFERIEPLPFTIFQSSSSDDLGDRLAIADLDGVHGNDIALGGDSGLTIALSDASGSFTSFQQIDTRRVNSLLALDADGDGDRDLLAVTFASQFGVFSYENLGGGNFAGPSLLIPQAGGGVPVLRVMQFDNDTVPDVFVSTRRVGVRVLRRNGSGFTVVDLSSSLPHNSTAAPFDFDGDGDDDFLTADANEIRVYENTGGAIGTSMRVADAPPISFRFEAGDFDADGNGDLLASNGEAPLLIRGRGDLTFDPPTTLVTPSGQSVLDRGIVSLGDANGDGIEDALLGLASETQVLFGQPNAQPISGDELFFSGFAGSRTFIAGRTNLNSDGRPDFIVWTRGSGANQPPRLQMARFETAGRSSLEVFPGLPAEGVVAEFPFAIADFDLDGKNEALSLSGAAATVLRYSPGPPTVSFEFLTRDIRTACTLDVDSDGDPDVLALSANMGEFWLENVPGQPFVERPGPIAGASQDLSTLVAIDFDGDGDEDVVQVLFATQSPGGAPVEVLRWRNDGLAQFTALPPIPLTAGPGLRAGVAFPSVLDADGDDDLDLWLAGWNDLLENDGQGNFTQQHPTFVGEPPRDSALVDYDLDGRAEVLGSLLNSAAPCGRSLNVWEASPAGFTRAAESRFSSCGASAWNLLDLDGDGDLDLNNSTLRVNRAIDLSARFLPALGLDFEVNLRLAAGGPSAARFASLGIAPRLSPSVIPTSLGSFDLSDPVFLPFRSLPNDGSPETLRIPVPNDSALVGAKFFLQASFVHVSPSLQLRFFSSAVLEETIVH